MPNYKLKTLLHFTLLCMLGQLLAVQAEQRPGWFKEVICNSITISTISDFNQLQNCSIVSGHVRIIEMDITSSDFDQLKASNLEEITDYLLVYRAHGLDSLERLFPKLVVIRGIELLYDEYALVVVENRNMENVGLISLLRVLRGSIRIENNPSLCFVNTINWAWILGNHTKQYYYDLHNNKSPNECPLCYTYEDEMEVKEVNRHKRCWSHNKFQKTVTNCSEKTNCLTSCSNRNCQRCTNYVSENGCMDVCLPNKYRLAFKYLCVANCTQWNMAQLGIECVWNCPQHYEEILLNGARTCVLNCEGDFVINSGKDLQGLEDCSKIEGSLTIELHSTNEPIVEMLENAFRNLNEVTGYIKILNSPQIISFHFFKNLHTIGGSQLIENRYALYVLNNRYLQETFLNKIIGKQGCYYFHLNPRLCFIQVFFIQTGFKGCNRVTFADASPTSNGDGALCGAQVGETNATITDVNSDSVIVELSALKHSDLDVQVGYVYYYKEAPFKNVTKFDGRHGCGTDTWITEIVLDIRRRHILRNLKPATQYAYFVNSMSYIDYPISVEVSSKLQYFKTLPSKPGTVAKIFYDSLSQTEIELHWWPPRITNGVLDKYILQYEITNSTTPTAISNQTVSDEDCQCPKLHTDSYVPTPHVDNYYSKERLYYIDSLLNFIYVKREVNITDKTTKSLNGTTTKTSNSTTASTIKIDETTARTGDTIMDNNVDDTDIDTTTIVPATVKPDTGAGSNSTNMTKEALFYQSYKELEIQWNLEAYMRQDADAETFVIPHPKPVCGHTNSTQFEDDCVPLEVFEGGIEIPGNQHSYILRNLEPEKTYRISLRACVKDLVNGCGAAKVVYAQTVSTRLETMIKSLTSNQMGMFEK